MPEQPRAGSRVPPNLGRMQDPPGPPPGPRAPQPPSGEKRRLRRGRSSKQLQRPGLASERAPLPRPCRRPSGPPAVPGAALSRTRSTRGESRPLPGWLWRLLKRPGQRRTGKSGLTCHYFLRHLGSPFLRNKPKSSSRVPPRVSHLLFCSLDSTKPAKPTKGTTVLLVTWECSA